MKGIVLLLLLSVSVNFSFGQTSFERNYYNLQQAEKQIFELPFDTDNIVSTIIPEIHNERGILAPHYPDRSGLSRDITSLENAFQNWISNYPNEFEAYLKYLKVYYRTNK